MDLLKLITSFSPTPKVLKNKVNYKTKPVGASYYALRLNKSKAGLSYTKLVKADRSNLSGKYPYIEPSVGHNSRRQAILNKRANSLATTI